MRRIVVRSVLVQFLVLVLLLVVGTDRVYAGDDQGVLSGVAPISLSVGSVTCQTEVRWIDPCCSSLSCAGGFYGQVLVYDLVCEVPHISMKFFTTHSHTLLHA
jgi:hypothetical protein